MQVQAQAAEDATVTRAMTSRSLASIGFLAVLALGSLLIFWLQTRAIESGARVLNISGRQRMLSQRVALLSHHLVKATEPRQKAQLRQQLDEHEKRLRAAHHGLVQGDVQLGLPALAPAAVLAIYQQPPHQLDARMGVYLEAIRGLLEEVAPSPEDPHFLQISEQALHGELLTGLDAVVSAYQADQERQIAALQRAKSIVMVLTFLGIALMYWRVIQPMVVSVGRHLRELRTRENRLRRQGEQLRLTLENAPVGIATCDLSGRLLSANQALCKMLGYSEEELLETAYPDYVHPLDVEASKAMLRQVAEGKIDVYRREERFQRRDGSAMYGVLRVAVVVGNDNRPSMVIAQFEDRSDQLRIAEALRRQEERLTQVSRLSTMGEMAASIAHEVNQPLTAITTYAQVCRRLLTDSGNSQEAVAILEKIDSQGHRAGEVIRRIRSLAMRREEHRERARIGTLVEDAIRLAEADARFRSLTIVCQVEEGLPKVKVDKIQIQQVVLNLVRNAIDALTVARREDAIEVDVLLQANDQAIEVRVQDQGLGLSAESQTDLFEPLFTTKESGMGMGLAICRSIIDAHGGELWFTVGEPRGTTFHFTVPLEQTNPGPAALSGDLRTNPK